MNRLMAAWMAALGLWLGGNGLAAGQTVETAGASNVTAWAARLYGTYAGLTTGLSYNLKFAIGPYDGGTDEGLWQYMNNTADLAVTPGTTNETEGAFSRMVVELGGGTTYYYRAYLTTTGETFWATNSLTFASLADAPTNTPEVTHSAVTVDADGLLHWPLNFFAANGVIPTQGVVTLAFRVGSNETLIATLVTGKLNRAEWALDPSTTNVLFRTGDTLYGRLFSQQDFGDVPQTNSGMIGVLDYYGGLVAALSADPSSGEPGRVVLGRGLMTNRVVISWDTNEGHLTRDGHAVFDEGFMGSNSGLDADTLDGVDSTGFLSSTGDVVVGPLTLASGASLVFSNGAVVLHVDQVADILRVPGTIAVTSLVSGVSGFSNMVIRTPSIQGQFLKTGSITLKAGDNAHTLGKGGDITLDAGDSGCVGCGGEWSGKIYLVTQHTTLTLSSNRLSLANGQLAADIGVSSNLPVSGLRFANSYTGGVMTVQTTDGVNFYLK
jgi:hypothetical protein